MKRHAALLLVLAGCPNGNPDTVWLDTGRTELDVKLVDHEPPPF